MDPPRILDFRERAIDPCISIRESKVKAWGRWSQIGCSLIKISPSYPTRSFSDPPPGRRFSNEFIFERDEFIQLEDTESRGFKISFGPNSGEESWVWVSAPSDIPLVVGKWFPGLSIMLQALLRKQQKIASTKPACNNEGHNADFERNPFKNFSKTAVKVRQFSWWNHTSP